MPRLSKRKRDPNAPKGPLTAYMLFCADFRDQVKRDNPLFSFGQVGRELGRLWKEADTSHRDKYERLAVESKNRYAAELQSYHEAKLQFSSSSEEEPTASKGKKRRRDPNAPKGALSAYMIFSRDVRNVVKEQFPDASFGEIGRRIGEKWRSMVEEDKKQYIESAEQDKKRHTKEMNEYSALQKRFLAEESESSADSSSDAESQSSSAHSGSDWNSSADEGVA